MEFTTVRVHDSEMFENVLNKQEKKVMADKGYANKKRKEEFTKRGIQYTQDDYFHTAIGVEDTTPLSRQSAKGSAYSDHTSENNYLKTVYLK